MALNFALDLALVSEEKSSLKKECLVVSHDGIERTDGIKIWKQDWSLNRSFFVFYGRLLRQILLDDYQLTRTKEPFYNSQFCSFDYVESNNPIQIVI